MTSTELKKERLALISAHSAALKSIDTRIAMAGREERKKLPFGTDTQAVLKLVRGWQRSGNTSQDIAHELNRRKIPQNSGNRWSAVGVDQWIILFTMEG